ncbi:hypothetical protein ACQ4PT_057577 [Festuca glaucescens]
MAEKTAAGSSGLATGKEPEIDDMLAHLELRDDELDDVVIDVEEVKEYQKEARWMAIGKVHTSRSFSAEALFGKGIERRSCTKVRGLSVVGLRSSRTMMAGRIWRNVAFGGLYVWAQIHGIPELDRKEAVIDDLARKVGKTKEVQMALRLFFEGNYMRLWVIIDVGKPLMCLVSLSIQGEGRKRLAMKYEKIHFFCKQCGLLGHDHEECGRQMSSIMETGCWHFVKAIPQLWSHITSRVGFAGRGGLNPMGKKRSSQDATLDDDEDLEDSATSLVKCNPMEEYKDDDDHLGAKKKLDLGGTVDVNGGSNISGSEEDKEQEMPPPPPGHVNPRDDSKQRKTITPENYLATSATPDPMMSLRWNSRDVGKSSTVQDIVYLVQTYKPSLMFICETR